MRGGSVASSAVAGLVSAPAYDSLTKNFSNHTNSGKCGGSKKCVARARGTSACAATRGKCAARACSKKGGSTNDAITAVSHSFSNAIKGLMSGTKEGFNVFRSEPAAFGSNAANLRGFASNASAKSGGTFKNMKEYMDSNTYSVRNRKGGAAPSLSLNYDAIKDTHPQASTFSRETPFEVDRMTSYQSPSSLQPMRPLMEYGGLSGVNSAKLPFGYAGVDKFAAGGARKAKKPAAKKPAAKKPVAKKPAAKKP